MKKKLQKINSLKVKSVYKYGTASGVRNSSETDPTTISYGTISTIVFKV